MPETPDKLESPEAPWRPILISIGAGLVLTLISIAILMVFYRIDLRGGLEPVRPKPVPTPALLTYLFRNGPPPDPRRAPPPGIDAAMRAVAARGANAYAPPGAP